MPYRPPKAHEKKRRIDRRKPSSKRGYGGSWRRWRLMVLAEEPLCRECLAAGRVTPATDVDHIVPLADGGTNERGNLQALCHSCHSRKTARQSSGWGE